ncbi:SAUR auxin-responsive protein [Salix suchowensis]|nr:SAUR auxin-responsive protein [Salix suchowensis]
METMKASTSSTSYVRLDRMEEGTKLDHRKGVFPVLVGSEGTMEKFLLPMKLTKHPFIAQLLELSAKEYGYEQEGLLKIPYDASCFKKMLKLISKK